MNQFHSLNLESKRVDMGISFHEGSRHERFSLGYQDSYFLIAGSTTAVGIICDGCSSTEWGASKNQVGAILGAEAIAHALHRRMLSLGKDDGVFSKMLKRAVDDTMGIFKMLIRAFKKNSLTFNHELFIQEKLTFTFIGIAVHESNYWIFGLGNGCYGFNNSMEILTDVNAYISSNILDGSSFHQPRIYSSGNLLGINNLWVASDGFEKFFNSDQSVHFSNFLEDDRTCFRNGDGHDETVRSFRANILRNNANLFSDDSTMIVFKLTKKDN